MKMKILILGATGMLGHTLFYYFSKNLEYIVYGTERNDENVDKFFSPEFVKRIIPGVDALNIESVENVIKKINPDVVINCIGIIKQLQESKDPILSISINSLFPHQLADICTDCKSRLIHISTDCVFDGKKGNYMDNDFADSDDLYGRTKFLGEVDYSNAVTLRTSIIGHELKGKLSLIDWFLAQEGEVKGFDKAIYTGFPTIEFASIMDKYVIHDSSLKGLYHVSSDPISKYELLKLVAKIYKKDIIIYSDSSIKIDRSLNSDRFRFKTGYVPLPWEKLINRMYDDYLEKQYKAKV